MTRYLHIRVNGKPKQVHRLIWEEAHGVKIPKGYVIHHADGNSRNNDPNNLILMTARDHAAFHNKARANGTDPVDATDPIVVKERARIKKYSEEHKEEIKLRQHDRYLRNKDRVSEVSKEYYENHKEQISERHKSYYKRFAQTLRDWHKKDYAENRDAILLKQKRHYALNKEVIRERHREYYRRNRDAILARQRMRKAELTGVRTTKKKVEDTLQETYPI